MKKINIAQFAKNQGKQSPALDLIQVVKDAYSDIQECLLLQVKPIEELPKINAMSKLFNMSVARAAVFAVIYCRSEHEVRLSEKGVVSILRNYFDGDSRNIRLEIKELKRLGLIERNREEGLFYPERKICRSTHNHELYVWDQYCIFYQTYSFLEFG